MSGLSQEETGSKLSLEAYCISKPYLVDLGVAQDLKSPFILCIRNKSNYKLELWQIVQMGHKGDERHNDITFELLYLSGKDTINVLDSIGYENVWRRSITSKVIIFQEAAHCFESMAFEPLYFKRPGKYLIRFTLLERYAPEYLPKRVVTDWIAFDVQINDERRKNELY